MRARPRRARSTHLLRWQGHCVERRRVCATGANTTATPSSAVTAPPVHCTTQRAGCALITAGLLAALSPACRLVKTARLENGSQQRSPFICDREQGKASHAPLRVVVMPSVERDTVPLGASGRYSSARTTC
jgi:hypothetical protein